MSLLTSDSFETEYSRRIINRGGEKGARKGERRTLLKRDGLRGPLGLHIKRFRVNYVTYCFAVHSCISATIDKSI